MPIIKGIPPEAILSKVIGLLAKEYMSNPAFAKERKAIQSHYTEAIRKVATAVLDWAKKLPSLSLDSLATDESLLEDLRNRLENPSDLAPYLDQLDSLCRKHFFDYPWAPKLLFYEDIYNAMQLNDEQNLIFLSGALSRIVGTLPVFLLPIPSAVIYLGTKREIHEYVDNWLNNLAGQFDGKDNPHALKLHVKWFYANKVLGKEPEDIVEDPHLNPRYLEDKLEVAQVRRAIRNLDRLLGGKPRLRGRPPKSVSQNA